MFFHLTEPGLQAGDLIAPGRWGSIVLSTPNHRWAPMELYFEQARTAIAPDAPSRLACVYLFEKLEAARMLRTQRSHDAIYEVELVDPAARSHRANMMLIHPSPNAIPWPGNATAYWNSAGINEPGAVVEVLVACSARVVGTISESHSPLGSPG